MEPTICQATDCRTKIMPGHSFCTTDMGRLTQQNRQRLRTDDPQALAMAVEHCRSFLDALPKEKTADA